VGCCPGTGVPEAFLIGARASNSGYVTGTGSGTVSAISTYAVSIYLQTKPSSGGGGGSGGMPGFPVETTLMGIILVVVVLSVRKRSSS